MKRLKLSPFFLTIFYSFLASATEPMNIEVLRKTYKIDKSCEVYPRDLIQSSPSTLIDFWCEGSLVHRFEDENEDSIWDIHRSFEQFGLITKIDKNYDHKIDFKQTILIAGENAKVSEFEDQQQNGNFRQINSYSTSLWHEDIKTCEPLYTYTFFDSAVNNLMNTIRACSDPKWNLWIDKSCGSFMKPIINHDLEKGMACLNRGKSYSKIKRIIGKIESLILYQDPAINVSCVSGMGKARARARYPVGLPLTYPSMEISKDHYKSKSSYPRDSGTIFHEYLHLALRENHFHKNGNVNKIDDVIMCQTCCFGSKDNASYLRKINSKWAVSQACKFCNGADKNINNYRAFMSLYASGSATRSFFKKNIVKSRVSSRNLKNAIK